MGRNEKGKMKYSKGSDNFNNKNAPKNKPVHKDNSHKDHNHKDNRQKSAQPQRKTSKAIIQVKNNNIASQNTSNITPNKPKAQPQPRIIRGPVDSSKLNEVKQSLIQLQNLINTYEEVQMDKQTNLKNLIDFIQSKSNIVK